MTYDELRPIVDRVARQVLPTLAGVLAAHGLLSPTQTSGFIEIGVAAVIGAGSLAWSLVSHRPIIATALGAAPSSEITATAAAIAMLRQKGGNPATISTLAEDLLALAKSEMAAFGALPGKTMFVSSPAAPTGVVNPWAPHPSDEERN